MVTLCIFYSTCDQMSDESRFYLIRVASYWNEAGEAVGIVKVPTKYLIGTAHHYYKQGKGVIRIEEISETEYTSYEALTFTVFEWVQKYPVHEKTRVMPIVDIYDPNFFEAVEHHGAKHVALRMDRRFLVKGKLS